MDDAEDSNRGTIIDRPPRDSLPDVDPLGAGPSLERIPYVAIFLGPSREFKCHGRCLRASVATLAYEACFKNAATAEGLIGSVRLDGYYLLQEMRVVFLPQAIDV